jgi:hypothetical protein
VQLDDRARDREPEPGAAGLEARAGVDPVEAVEDAFHGVGGHARALVGHLDADPAAGAGGRGHGDLARRRAVPDGVGEQVGQHLVDAVRIAGHEQLAVDLGHDADLRVDRGDLGRGVGHDLADLELLPVDPDGAGLELSQLQQLVDQPTQPLGALEHGRDGLAVQHLDAVGQVLKPGPQRRDRRAQLVADVGQQLAPLTLDLVQPGGHGVERPGQAADLVLAGGPDPLAVVTAGHGLGGGHHLAQRGDHAVGQELDHHQRDDQGAHERVPGVHVRVDGGEDGPDGGRHRPDDDQPELHLDRPDPVQRTAGQAHGGHQ